MIKKINFLEKLYMNYIGGGKIDFLPSSVDGHYPVLAKGHFYKFAFKNEQFFNFEKYNIKYLKKINEISEYIPNYEYHFKYFKTNVYTSIENKNEHLKCAEKILDAFSHVGEQKSIKLEELEYIIKGLDIIKIVTDEQVFQICKEKVERILEKYKFRIGICHGDFHPKNILKNKDKPVVIDFDCVRKISIQEFDCLYFVIQSIIDYDTKNVWWHDAINYDMSDYFDFISKYIDKNIDIEDLKFIFFIDRIGQDSKYYSGKEEIPVNDILKYLKQQKLILK